MTATTPQSMEGTQAPNQIEYLYERYRPLLKWILILVIVAYAAAYGYKWQHQRQIDQAWTGFATSIGLDVSYVDKDAGFQALADHLADKSLSGLETELAAASPVQAPWLHLAIARKAMLDHNWDRAESALKEIETKFPNHSICQASEFPVQVRDMVKQEPGEPKAKKPEFKPWVKGSIVSQMREQIAAAKGYVEPSQFAKVEVPPTAKKVQFTFSGEYGTCTIALMPQAPKHVEAFLALAANENPFWKGLAVDEIQRNGKGFMKRPMQFHFGYETTKEEERSKWTKTEESKHQLDFEETGLSHFPGAVSGSVEADGKSCVDRIWINVEDAPEEDGERVVFGMVIEGLDNLRKICEAAMTAQEEDSGQGVPSDTIRITDVKVLE
ncbi:MAG: peptidylprolyl isomerase [Planctomycetota bacterium]